MHRIIREYSVLSKMWAVFLQKYVLGFLTLLCRVQLGSSYSQSCKSALVMLHIKVLERTTHNHIQQCTELSGSLCTAAKP